jgi:hypothetical protein
MPKARVLDSGTAQMEENRKPRADLARGFAGFLGGKGTGKQALRSYQKEVTVHYSNPRLT